MTLILLVESYVINPDDPIENGFFASIHENIQAIYPDDPEKVQCLLLDLQKDDLLEMMQNPDILSESSSSIDEITKFREKTESWCDFKLFVSSATGLSLIGFLVILAFCPVAFVIWRRIKNRKSSDAKVDDLELDKVNN